MTEKSSKDTSQLEFEFVRRKSSEELSGNLDDNVAPATNELASQECEAAREDSPSLPADQEGPIEAATGEGSAAPATLFQLYGSLSSVPSASRRVIEQRCAIRVVGRVLNLPLEGIPTEPGVLGSLLAKAAPAASGVKPARWTKIRSQVRAAMMEAGIAVMKGRTQGGLTPAWQELYASLPNKRLKAGTSRFLRYLCAQRIEPNQVKAEHFERYREMLTSADLNRNPSKAYRTTVSQWNAAVVSVPAWPSEEGPRTVDPRRYALAREGFHAAFLADMDEYLNGRRDPDPFSDDWWKPARPATVDARRKQILQLATGLVTSGFPVENLTSLMVLVDLANAEAALRCLYDRKGGSTQHLGQQAYMLAAVARHWVKVPPEHYSKLRGFASRLEVRASGMTNKNQASMRQFDLPENVTALLMLPSKVLKEARRCRTAGPEVARRVMLAVAVEVLIMAPMRLKNLTNLEIGKHVLETRRGGRHIRHIVVPDEDVKNSQPFQIELPPESCRLIDAYMTDYRRHLCSAGSSHLFPNEVGEGRNHTAFSRAITEFVAGETGLRLTPHQFRQLAGKLHLNVHPQGIETMRQVLGHTSTRTTLRAYVQVQRGHAYRNYDATISSLREGAVRRPPDAGKKQTRGSM